MAGLVASMGVAFGCLMRNLILWPQMFAHNWSDAPANGAKSGALPGTGVGDMLLTLVLALLMIAWMWAFALFVRREPRSPLTWVASAIIGGGFLWLCWQNWQLAYPVCNAF